MEIIIDIFKKLKLDLLCDITIPFLVTFPKYSTFYSRNTFLFMFIVAPITIPKKQKQLRYLSTDEWMLKCGTFI